MFDCCWRSPVSKRVDVSWEQGTTDHGHRLVFNVVGMSTPSLALVNIR